MMVPTTKRYGAGKYKVHSGEEYVAVLRAGYLGGWLAQPKGSPDRLIFKTKREACEWAYDWLVEYA